MAFTRRLQQHRGTKRQDFCNGERGSRKSGKRLLRPRNMMSCSNNRLQTKNTKVASRHNKLVHTSSSQFHNNRISRSGTTRSRHTTTSLRTTGSSSAAGRTGREPTGTKRVSGSGIMARTSGFGSGTTTVMARLVTANHPPEIVIFEFLVLCVEKTGLYVGIMSVQFTNSYVTSVSDLSVVTGCLNLWCMKNSDSVCAAVKILFGSAGGLVGRPNIMRRYHCACCVLLPITLSQMRSSSWQLSKSLRAIVAFGPR